MYKILLIDDEVNFLQATATMLELHNFDTVTALSGFQGIEMMLRHRPDVVICDFGLPDITGLEVLKYVRNSEQLKHIPFLVLSAYAECKTAIDRSTYQPEMLLSKPLPFATLLSNINTYTNHRNETFI